MSGVIHEHEDVFEETEEEYVDAITEWFLESGPGDSIVIHDHECPSTDDDRRICTCIPVTLTRGATA